MFQRSMSWWIKVTVELLGRRRGWIPSPYIIFCGNEKALLPPGRHSPCQVVVWWAWCELVSVPQCQVPWPGAFARCCCKWKTCGYQSFDLTWKQEPMLNDSASRYCPQTPDNKQIVLLQNHEPCFPLHSKICPSWKWLQLPHKNMAPNNIAASPVWRAGINMWFLPSCHPLVSDALLCAMYYSSEMNGCSPYPQSLHLVK